MFGSGEPLLIFAVGAKLGEETLAEQLALVPPSELLQLHDQGPDPDTPPGVPELHKLEDGAEVKDPPLAEPQLAGVPQLRVAPFV